MHCKEPVTHFLACANSYLGNWIGYGSWMLENWRAFSQIQVNIFQASTHFTHCTPGLFSLQIQNILCKNFNILEYFFIFIFTILGKGRKYEIVFQASWIKLTTISFYFKLLLRFRSSTSDCILLLKGLKTLQSL